MSDDDDVDCERSLETNRATKTNVDNSCNLVGFSKTMEKIQLSIIL